MYRNTSDQIDRIDAATNVELGGLTKMIANQEAAIRDLTVTVGVLSKMLIDAGVLDEQVLKARVSAGIEEAAEANLVQCMSCNQRVPAARTQITAAGPVCDGCTA